MKHLPKILPALAALAALACLAFFCAAARAETIGMFDTTALQQTPEIEWGKRDGLTQQVWFSNVPYHGKPTRVFAYVGRPKGPGPFPAMVLLHGGGGQAFREWAEHWAQRGYVAIAPDLRGLGPDGETRHAQAGADMGNPSIFKAADSDAALRDGWTYHAVSAAMQGLSVLQTMPEVNPALIGITGISWGGYTTCITAAIDRRVKVAVPVYGCGWLQDNSWRKDVIDALTAEQRERWVRFCDPSSYLGRISCPFLFVNSANDTAFYLDSTLRSAALVRPEYRNLAIIIGLKHGHNWKIPEVDRFVDAVLAGGAPAPRFSMQENKGRLASAKVSGVSDGSKVFINYAKTDKPWKDRQWTSAPAKLAGDTISATLPGNDKLVWYFSIADKNNVSATSECGGTAGVDVPSATTKLPPQAPQPPASPATPAQPAREPSFTNSIGMEFVAIEAGTFQMGEALGKEWFTGGEWDESPVRKVEITQPFLMGVTEVTNAQYEQFDPGHRAKRGRRGFTFSPHSDSEREVMGHWEKGGQKGFSAQDNEAVTFVSWEDAARFCEWLSAKEGKPYRLPTEAEWEYACRAGTTTAYHTGDTLPEIYHREQSSYDDHNTDHAKPVSLKVKQSPPNAWGLYDMHGNLEEWCLDWFGPYDPAATRDPVGRTEGHARVTRGGSHNTDVYFLRSANRASALPGDAFSFYTGFRVVQAPMPATKPSPAAPPPLVMSHVSQEKHDWKTPGYDSAQPWFRGPRPYVKVPKESRGPLFWFHNHGPSITFCDNGDLLATWFSSLSEWGREFTIAGARLRLGYDEWDPASLFFDLADRSVPPGPVCRDKTGRLWHSNHVGAVSWHTHVTILRSSDDNGATWSQPRIYVKPDGPVETSMETKAGRHIRAVDASGSTEVLVSDDNGKNWRLPSQGARADDYTAGGKGRRIAGIHAPIVELADGSLLAFGRGSNIEGKMPMSRSRDGGETWGYSASEFPRIAAGQRPLLWRLREGPLLFVSFTDALVNLAPFKLGEQRGRGFLNNGIIVKDAAGKQRTVFGLFAALSFDEGKTWPVKKLITPGGETKTWFGHGWTKFFITDDTHAEPAGYLASVQTPDGRIHVLSSGLHYEFNLAWLKEPMPAEKPKKN